MNLAFFANLHPGELFILFIVIMMVIAPVAIVCFLLIRLQKRNSGRPRGGPEDDRNFPPKDQP